MKHLLCHIDTYRKCPESRGNSTRVFEGLTYTFEDARFNYGEERFVTLGLLDGMVVSIVHTETLRSIRVISFRKATKHEQAIFFNSIKD
jgi:uncharacterized DUF497 family protein